MNTHANRTSISRPRFLELNGRRLFALEILPTGPCTQSFLYLPPLAEEMNRCRSHVAAMARALAATGVHTLLLDPYGSGESEGEIEEGNWDFWLADAESAARWLSQDCGQRLTLWGTRTGALLAAELADRIPELIERLLFWQPVLDGKLFMTQYLRLRIGSQLVSNTERETTEQIRQRLAAGEIIEIAGYPLSGSLASQIACRRAAACESLTKLPVVWIEMTGQSGLDLSPASRQFIEARRQTGARIEAEAVACPMIWQLHRRADAPDLQTVSLRLLGVINNECA
jgi:exosortase A-associated hydrolase 2